MLEEIVKIALKEDDVLHDITSDLTIDQDAKINFEIRSRENIIFCGQEAILEVFSQLRKSKKFKNCEIDLELLCEDGSAVKSGSAIACGLGHAKLVFAAERVILNLIQHLSGIATQTNKFITALDDKNIKILDTRKTIAGLRAIQKYAVLKAAALIIALIFLR